MILITYDISNDKVRSKFSKFLDKYGRRLQYSVYEIKNSDRILENIVTEINMRYEKKFTMSDSVMIFFVCEACMKKVLRFGFAKNEETDLIIV